MLIDTLANRIQQTVEPTLIGLLKPQKLARLATLMPKPFNHFMVEKLINIAFAEQVSEGDFDFLENRQFQVEIIDADLFICLSFKSDKIICKHMHNSPLEAEVTLSINSVDAISLIEQDVDPDTLFFQRKLKIKGDTDLAHHVKNIIDTLDPEIIPVQFLKFLSGYKKRVLINLNSG